MQVRQGTNITCFGFESPHYDSHDRIPAGKKILYRKSRPVAYKPGISGMPDFFAECLVRHYPFNVDNVNATGSAFS